MTFESFVEKIENAVRSYLGKDVDLAIHQFIKNNGVELTGLVFAKKDSDIAATVYLEDFYEKYESGRTLGETVQEILAVYESNRPRERLDMGFFGDYEQVRLHLCCRLINREKNGTLLEQVPHRTFLDLAVVFGCILMGDDLGCGCILINNDHLRFWKVSEEQLAEDAQKNMAKILPSEIWHMEDLIFQMVRDSMAENMEETETGQEELEVMLDGMASFITEHHRPNAGEMLVLTNCQHFFGAAAILYPGLLSGLAQEKGCSFYILPCSVHEVILIGDTEEMPGLDLGGTVKEVNRMNVPKEEFLSDAVYYYDKEKDSLRLL